MLEPCGVSHPVLGGFKGVCACVAMLEKARREELLGAAQFGSLGLRLLVAQCLMEASIPSASSYHDSRQPGETMM